MNGRRGVRGMSASRSTSIHLSDPHAPKVPACGSRSSNVTADRELVTCRTCLGFLKLGSFSRNSRPERDR